MSIQYMPPEASRTKYKASKQRLVVIFRRYVCCGLVVARGRLGFIYTHDNFTKR